MFPLPDIHGLLSDINQNTRSLFLKRLAEIYAAMDQKYRDAADHYGFSCTGCDDNCCLTRFYHHTLLEYLYILKGFRRLESKKQTELKNRALDVCQKAELADEKGLSVRLMCPLNVDGLCLLYKHRPMICRMHGIPHELKSPDGRRVHGPGCDAFSRQCMEKSDFNFDRTPFYLEMALLEKELKQTAGAMGKVRFTVAQMLLSFHK
ncbi:MAG: hypothetical protein ABII68_01110 [Pseudomonadota bacterium]